MGNECTACANCQKVDKQTEILTQPRITEPNKNTEYATDSKKIKSIEKESSAKGKENIPHNNIKISPSEKKKKGVSTTNEKSFSKNEGLSGSKYFSNQDFCEESINNIPSEIKLTKEKRPPYTFPSGAVYEGEWLGNMREGFGIQNWLDGAKYEAHGKGKFWHVDGDIYEGRFEKYFLGEWEDDKANGYGHYIHVNGAKYEGYWKNDMQDGYGVEIWADGSKYDGYYKEGKKHGEGTYIWSDGSKYSGKWDENKINGFGVYVWLDGRQYTGNWKNNNMHGKGVYTWQDGRKYEGEYQWDKKHGFGIYIWADGRKYEGNWTYGKQHGKGKYVLSDGIIKFGIWENGKRIKWCENEESEDNEEN